MKLNENEQKINKINIFPAENVKLKIKSKSFKKFPSRDSSKSLPAGY